MRSEATRRILKRISPDTRQFVRKYADIIVRINQLLAEKKMTQAALAEKMGKKPSEISRWLSGEHNLTLLSLCKLEVELEADIIYVPRPVSFETVGHTHQKFVVYRNDMKSASNVEFIGVQSENKSNNKTPVAIAS